MATRLRIKAMALLGAYVLIASLAVQTVSRPAASADTSSWQWYKTDPHVHSVLSSDATDDIGILKESFKESFGFDAIFLSDHEKGSTFSVSGKDANNTAFDDSYAHWVTKNSGSLTASSNELVDDPVNSGTRALRLAATSTSSSYGETFVYAERGPNLRSGDIILKFSVYPGLIKLDSGLYVSASIGGDPSVQKPTGYTTKDGTISPGKSTVLVWQLGNPRVPSTDPQRRVVVNDLSFTPYVWNHYTINVTEVLQTIPPEDLPVDSNAVTFLKMAAAGKNGGSAEGFFDSYSIKPTDPKPPVQEFADRNVDVPAYDEAAFRVFPSIELGQREHTQRFNFGGSDTSQWKGYFYGTDGIADTQESGYPAMLDHPAVPGGTSLQGTIDTEAYGADLIEVKSRIMADAWDGVLRKGTPIIAAGSSDTHHSIGGAGNTLATHLYSPALEFDPLMKSFFEGRSFVARRSFPGVVTFNLEAGSAAPYPARYPVYVSDAQSAASVHLSISKGLKADDTIRWIVNGSELSTEAPGAGGYDAAKSIPLTGSSTYVRAEVLSSSGSITALTQPIFFRAVPSLPTTSSFAASTIHTPGGRDYTKIATKGVVSAAWNPTVEILALGLRNPTDSVASLSMNVLGGPQRVKVDGSEVAPAASLAEWESATGSSWFYDPAAAKLLLKVLHPETRTGVLVEFSDESDTAAPTVPAGLAGDPAHDHIDLSWSASSDDTGVVGYTIYRDGAELDTVDTNSLSYTDRTVTPNSTYTYEIDAFDASGNHSSLSDPVTAISLVPPTSFSFDAQADAYTNEFSPGQNYGSATTVRIDARSEPRNSPLVQTYLQFKVAGLTGPVGKAILRLVSITSSATGFDVRNVADTSWEEGDLTYNNAPPIDTQIHGSSGPFGSGSRVDVDVTSLVEGDGTISIGLTTTTDVAMSLKSRESGIAPRLLVETRLSDTSSPTAPTALAATASSDGERVDLSWTASTDDTGVTGYNVYRDGTLLVTANTSTSYSDASVTPGTTYEYVVRARDAAGNLSDPSNSAVVTTSTTDTTPPSPPGDLTATSSSDGTRVDLAWTASTDDTGVIGYNVYRDGVLLVESDSSTSYSDTTVSPGTTYEYLVRARDAAGNLSDPSNTATVTTETATTTLFADDFETGDLSRWTAVDGLVVQNAQVHAGQYAARATSTGNKAWAVKEIAPGQSQLTYRTHFNVLSQGDNTAYLLKFRTGTGSSILGVYVSSTGKLNYRNDVVGRSTRGSTQVTQGTWHELTVRVKIAGTDSEVEIWLNGDRISDLSAIEDLGTTSIGQLQLGDNSRGRTFDIAFDDVQVSP